MKKLLYLLPIITLLIACGDDESVADDFEEANGDVPVRLMTQIATISSQDASENETINIEYANNRVVNISNGESTTVFVYENNDLTTLATTNNDPFAISELYQMPYDGFEYGEVLEYDSNNNPIRATVFRDSSNVTFEYTMEMIYDTKPNPFYHTLKAGGLIDIMDDVEINFSIVPEVAEIVQAKMLFPLNNLQKVTFKDVNNVLKYQVVADYTYGDDSYPTNATFTSTSFGNNEVQVFSTTYQYLD